MVLLSFSQNSDSLTEEGPTISMLTELAHHHGKATRWKRAPLTTSFALDHLVGAVASTEYGDTVKPVGCAKLKNA
jgi:hypothetical protein